MGDEEAAERFSSAIKLAPNMSLAYYGLGRANVARHRFVEAIEAYSNCRRLYVTRTSEQYTAQTDAARAREDELMELRELQRQNATGPQTTNSANSARFPPSSFSLMPSPSCASPQRRATIA